MKDALVVGALITGVANAVVGKIMVSTHGLMGILNDTTKSHLEVHDARLARIHMPTKLVDHFEVVRLIKSQLFAVCVARREDLGPTGIQRSGYTSVSVMPARITTHVYELEGKLEVAGRFDFAVTWSQIRPAISSRCIKPP